MMVCVASLNDVYYVLRRHYGSEGRLGSMWA